MTRQQAELLIAERVLDKIIGHIVDSEVALAIAAVSPTAKQNEVQDVQRLLDKLRAQVLPPVLGKLAALRGDKASGTPEDPRS